MDANHLLYAMAVTQLLLNYNSQELIFLHPAHVSFSDFFARKLNKNNRGQNSNK